MRSLAENSVQDLMELLDTDYDGQDALFSSRLDMRDRIRQEQTNEDLDREAQGDLAPDPYEQALQKETPGRRRLKRDLEREALLRLEEAARTSADFQYILSWWDRLDANRERRERYHEILRSGDVLPLETGRADDGAVFPAAVNPVLDRQLHRGHFLDMIFYCPSFIYLNENNICPYVGYARYSSGTSFSASSTSFLKSSISLKIVS